MGMSGSSGSNRGMMAEINVTPLVDVMLVLLIIFMISSSIETIQVQQENSESKRPADREPEPEGSGELPAPMWSRSTCRKNRNGPVDNPGRQIFVGETMISTAFQSLPAIKATVTGDSRRIWSVKDDAALGRAWIRSSRSWERTQSFKTTRNCISGPTGAFLTA